jgi:hypothetical protein
MKTSAATNKLNTERRIKGRDKRRKSGGEEID